MEQGIEERGRERGALVRRRRREKEREKGPPPPPSSFEPVFFFATPLSLDSRRPMFFLFRPSLSSPSIKPSLPLSSPTCVMRSTM